MVFVSMVLQTYYQQQTKYYAFSDLSNAQYLISLMDLLVFQPKPILCFH